MQRLRQPMLIVQRGCKLVLDLRVNQPERHRSPEELLALHQSAGLQRDCAKHCQAPRLVTVLAQVLDHALCGGVELTRIEIALRFA